MDTEKKCVRIELEYDNGEIWRATGEDAQKIRENLDSQTVMMWIHGMPYSGPTLKLVEKK